MSDMEQLYEKILAYTNDLLHDHDPLEVAAILTTVAMRMYRTALDDQEYENMIDAISDSRSAIKSFTPTLN